MALYINTEKPEELWRAINAGIKSKKIDTWQLDGDGDYTHVPQQWSMRAWLRPYKEDGKLIMGILGRRDEEMSKVEYAVYHGRFVEMLLSHFDTEIDDINITSFPDANYDSIYIRNSLECGSSLSSAGNSVSDNQLN